jgi:hypothetical protein
MPSLSDLATRTLDAPPDTPPDEYKARKKRIIAAYQLADTKRSQARDAYQAARDVYRKAKRALQHRVGASVERKHRARKHGKYYRDMATTKDLSELYTYKEAQRRKYEELDEINAELDEARAARRVYLEISSIKHSVRNAHYIVAAEVGTHSMLFIKTRRPTIEFHWMRRVSCAPAVLKAVAEILAPACPSTLRSRYVTIYCPIDLLIELAAQVADALEPCCSVVYTRKNIELLATYDG